MLSLLCLLLICFTVSQCWFHQTPDQILHQNLFSAALEISFCMNIFDGKLLMIVDLNRLLQKLYLFLKKKAELTALVSKKAQV